MSGYESPFAPAAILPAPLSAMDAQMMAARARMLLQPSRLDPSHDPALWMPPPQTAFSPFPIPPPPYTAAMPPPMPMWAQQPAGPISMIPAAAPPAAAPKEDEAAEAPGSPPAEPAETLRYPSYLNSLPPDAPDAVVLATRLVDAERQIALLQVELATANERAESFRALAAAKDEIIAAARSQTKEWRKHASEVLATSAKAAAGGSSSSSSKDKKKK